MADAAAEPAAPSTEPAPAAPAPATPDESGKAPELQDSTADLLARLDRIEQRLPEPQPEAEATPQDGALYDQLERELAELYGEDDGDLEAGVEENPEADDEIAAQLERYIGDQVEARLQPHVRRGELAALQDEFPDIMEPQMLERIGGILGDLADSYGNEALLTDPKLVRQAFLAIKAEDAAKNETPAESAATQGASLETGAGPSAQGEASPEDQMRAAILGAAGGGDAFT